MAESLNDYDRAMAAYERALQHNGNSLQALINVAGICRMKENYVKVRSVSLWKKSIRGTCCFADDRSPVFLFLFGYLHRIVGSVWFIHSNSIWTATPVMHTGSVCLLCMLACDLTRHGMAWHGAMTIDTVICVSGASLFCPALLCLRSDPVTR